MTTEISTTTTPARGLALQTFDDAWRFWQMVAKTEFAPKDFRGKPEACMLAGQHAAEIGIGPMQGLQCIAVINGRPSIWGDAALALVQSSHVCEWVTEQVEGDGDAMVATCTAKRRGYPQATTVQFSVVDAKKAGLWGKSGPWTQYPKRMLQLRARGFALRDAFPDVLKGLVTAEEAQDYPTPEPAREPVVVRPKFDAAPQATPTADEAHMQQRRLAVSKVSDVGKLEQMQATVEERLRSGFYTPAQADDLLGLINGRLDWLTGDNGQEFTHEAAEHEVQA